MQISKAYGGGRNLVPGVDLETKEQQEVREKEFRASMLEYKQSMGTIVEPEVEEEAQRLYDEVRGEGCSRAARGCRWRAMSMPVMVGHRQCCGVWCGNHACKHTMHYPHAQASKQ